MSIRGVGLAVVLAISAACPWNLAAQDRSIEHTSAPSTAESVVRRFWDAFSRGAWSELDDLVSPDFAHHPPGQTLTLAEFKAGGAFVHRAFADYLLTIDELIVSGDTVAIRWTATGTHVGSFFREAPTGRRIAVQGMDLLHLSAGRITDDFEVIDLAGLRAALQPR